MDIRFVKQSHITIVPPLEDDQGGWFI
jgi:hypothetical protein